LCGAVSRSAPDLGDFRPDSVRLTSQPETGSSLSRISCSPIKRNAPGLAIGNAYMLTAYSKSASRMALTGTNTRGTSSILHIILTEWNRMKFRGLSVGFDSFTILLWLPPRVFFARLQPFRSMLTRTLLFQAEQPMVGPSNRSKSVKTCDDTHQPYLNW
jgi:hypothetical protein